MKKEKMNDKGFSLVELIIVIAIMAVLVVVLAPQYLKYVERSRNSTDLQNATEIVTALQVYGSDPEATVSIPTAAINIKIDKSGTVALGKTSFEGAALIDAGLADADGNLKMKCQSKTLWDNYTITATPSNGGLVFTYSSAVGTTPNTNFQTKMEGNTPETSK